MVAFLSKALAMNKSPKELTTNMMSSEAPALIQEGHYKEWNLPTNYCTLVTEHLIGVSTPLQQCLCSIISNDLPVHKPTLPGCALFAIWSGRIDVEGHDGEEHISAGCGSPCYGGSYAEPD